LAQGDKSICDLTLLALTIILLPIKQQKNKGKFYSMYYRVYKCTYCGRDFGDIDVAMIHFSGECPH